MTVAAVNAAKTQTTGDMAYTLDDEDLAELESELAKSKVMRPEVEDPVELLQLAKNETVALLVDGDPLQATTHVDLQLQASEWGLNAVIHGISITGLIYWFNQVVELPIWKADYLDISLWRMDCNLAA